MRGFISCLPLLFLVLTGNISLAQNSIFAGKIINEKNRPVPGARVKVSQSGSFIDEVLADKDGLYYTKLLPVGNYNIDVRADGRYLKARKVRLKEADNVKWYYNFKMNGEKLEIIMTAHDPFMASKLRKLEEESVLFDYGFKEQWRTRNERE